ncbi:cupin [Sphingobium yanoikuyae]|uniref:Cupin n=1 Tax=Sphingobium yanoikuyae TaxID=13690 RepID=A0A177JWV4_SPHYA|nr:cupin domain-containing protein [Sphingobium yanoikuyae]OAH45367.1 cupin [Sphingobium yanoikuyae]
MHVNVDFSQRVVVHSSEEPWVASPMAGVDRRMLDRVGDEVARATTIVRYAPKSYFSPHTHGGGEEFLVLEGVFSDEHGDFPAGSYVRNPRGSRHTPFSDDGCTIFVKLWQFDPADQSHVRLAAPTLRYAPVVNREGVTAVPLHTFGDEVVRLESWDALTPVLIENPSGLELLVLDGTLSEEGDLLEAESWLRLPAGRGLEAVAGPAGCTVWIKTGHLADVDAQIAGMAL